jgi:hypothetical protein
MLSWTNQNSPDRSIEQPMHRPSHNLFLFLVLIGAALHPSPAHAQAKKPPEKDVTPRVITLTPFTLLRGQSNKVEIRGLNLIDVSAVRIEGSKTPLTATIKSQGPIDNPKKADPARTGDTRLVIDLPLPADLPENSLTLIVTAKAGDTKPQSLLVFDPGSIIDEKEPNGGFQTAQEIRIGQTIRGSIAEVGDVDVFQFHARAGDKLVAEVDAARHGSPLDSLLMLYAPGARELASNDDSPAGADSILNFTISTDGIYYLVLSDANGTGSPTHAYLLSLRTASPATRAASTKPSTKP